MPREGSAPITEVENALLERMQPLRNLMSTMIGIARKPTLIHMVDHRGEPKRPPRSTRPKTRRLLRGIDELAVPSERDRRFADKLNYRPPSLVFSCLSAGIVGALRRATF